LVDSPLYDSVWEDPDLSKRDRSLVTVAPLVATAHFEELPAHLRRAVENGVTRTELGALITHLAFYAGFPAAVTASAIANATLGQGG
jgi:4-carboxymuconolactone decarboxylase